LLSSSMVVKKRRPRCLGVCYDANGEDVAGS
jgi:hypothetical protein